VPQPSCRFRTEGADVVEAFGQLFRRRFRPLDG